MEGEITYLGGDGVHFSVSPWELVELGKSYLFSYNAGFNLSRVRQPGENYSWGFIVKLDNYTACIEFDQELLF